MKKLGERLVSLFKYLIAGYMILAGVVTIFADQLPASGPLGFLYSSRVALVIIGLLITYSGAVLLYGKIRRSRKWTGRGLFSVYLCFLFATALNAIAYNFNPSFWVGNAVGSLVTGGLWLRWKFKNEYVTKDYFKIE